MKLTKFLKSFYTALAFFLFQIQTTFADIAPSNTKPINIDLPTLFGTFKLLTLPLIIITILLELPIFYFIGSKSKEITKVTLTVILMNAITLTLAHYISYYAVEILGNQSQHSHKAEIYQLNIVLFLSIIIIKGIIFKIVLKEISLKRSMLTSLLANTASLAIVAAILSLIPSYELYFSNHTNFINYLHRLSDYLL